MPRWADKGRTTRATMIRDLWCHHGCPAKMTIHIKGTGERILVLDGFIQPPETSQEGLRLRQEAPHTPDSRLDSMIPGVETLTPIVCRPVTDNRVCEWCRETFSSTRRDAKYCSSRCRKAAQRSQAKERRERQADELLAKVVSVRAEDSVEGCA